MTDRSFAWALLLTFLTLQFLFRVLAIGLGVVLGIYLGWWGR